MVWAVAVGESPYSSSPPTLTQETSSVASSPTGNPAACGGLTRFRHLQLREEIRRDGSQTETYIDDAQSSCNKSLFDWPSVVYEAVSCYRRREEDEEWIGI
ncbi:hypothetical protein OPV22_015956 [Ensete ventricosum]|uniref:Uncharacterized protein n=1 Tax=Ensete ventricosum TaxID=4639 RepID=A0AAV8R500_ENSVE|nr:hypothetical protein OPV22_015956 [Ensete ventricosum]